MSTKQNKTSSVNKKEAGLSSVNCNNTFKTLLRSSGDENRERDVLRVPINKTKEIKTFPSDKTDIFNDKYKQLQENVNSLREKYLNNYVKGTLKSTITTLSKNKKLFSPPESKDSDSKFSTMRLKVDILKANPEIKEGKRVGEYEKFYNNLTPNKSIFVSNVNSTKGKQQNPNPIRSMSAEELTQEARYNKLKNKNKGEKVNSYLGSSDDIKAVFCNTSQYQTYSDKITCNNFKNMSSPVAAVEPKHYLKNNKHNFDKTSGRGFYA